VGERRAPAPHGVTWYLRRLLEGQHASPEVRARAEAIGLVVPAGYTFVDAHVWPRAADPRTLPTALRTTVALSGLRAILDGTRARPADLRQ
jgi:hypothetical protein